MTVVSENPRTAGAPSPRPRDRGVDLVRAVCVVVVVLLHALMVGATVDASGPVFANAADGAAWFAPLTWVAQVMPLFFVIGGFAGAHAFRRARERGATATAFVTGRVRRLLVPAVVVIGVVGVALIALLCVGVPADLVQVAGFRFGQPLWFLGVFLLCQALLPVLLVAHEKAPARTLTLLVGAAVVVDVVRGVTGVDAFGIANLAFVWLALQQIGFVLADGRIDALRVRTRALIGVAAVAALVVSCNLGVYSPDLFVNLNPPTTALVLLGVAQTIVFSLLRRPLALLSDRPRIARFTEFVTPRTMTIYLWHMPVLLMMAGVAALLAMHGVLVLPEPSSTDWWLGRPLWLALALAGTAVAALLLGRVERVRHRAATTSTVRTGHAVLLGLAGIVLLLVAGTTPFTAAIAVALIIAALARASAPRAAAPTSRPGQPIAS